MRWASIAFCVVACALGLFAAPASAALPTHPELPALNQTGFQRVCGLAVDSAGNRYVADYANAGDKVKIYSPSGTLITSFAPSVNAEAPCALAVDSQGNLYVNGLNTDVVKYKPSAFPPTSSTTYEPDTSINSTGVLAEFAHGVAVDPATDNVYVAFEGHISSYQPDGTPISETLGEAATEGGATFVSVAVRGKTGRIYAYDRNNEKAYVFSPDGSKILSEVNGATTKAESFNFGLRAIAVDQSNGHFYVADIGNNVTGHKVVDEFDSGGELVSEISTPSTLGDPTPAGIAVDNSAGANDGDLFVGAGLEPSSVLAFGPLTYAQFFELKVTKTGAGQGTVTSAPAGVDCGTTCKVSIEEGSEVTLTAVAATGSKFAGWKGCDSASGNECTVTMSAARQVTAKFTAKPTIESEDVSPLDTSAQLDAEINPNGEETSYQFEFLSEDAYQANGESFSGPEEPLRTPASPESIGNGDEAVTVSATVEGLTPHAAYRFRIVTSNPVGTSEGGAFAFTTYLSPQVFEPCANDSFRTGASAGLPDCRAYEQASPVDKNGGDLTGSIRGSKASIDGDRVSFQATSPIPGGEGSQTFTPLYQARRGANGWSTTGLLPPQSEGRRAQVLGWTPDFTHVFEWAMKIGSPNFVTLLDRSTATGTVSTIIPHTARFQPNFAGSSTDGSIAFIEDEGGSPLTANALNGTPNLYVTDRKTEAVSLAGVFNDGQAPPAGSFAGPYSWMENILHSGGGNAGYYLSDEHAIAPDGSSTYFTAANTGQLYLRLNPTKPQSPLDSEGECTDAALACTIHVSASLKHNGTGPEGNDPAGPHPAAFLGASRDGSVAFFTSSEMLTNKANTGPEQPPARIGRAKIGASEAEEVKPSILPKHAIGLATSPDGEYIYWADPVARTIGRAKLNGDGTPSEIKDDYIVPGVTEAITRPKTEPGVLHPVPASPRYVAVNDEYVYWSNTGPKTTAEDGDPNDLGRPLPGTGTIGRAKIGANSAELVEPAFITGATNPQGIALDSDHVYWADEPNPIEDPIKDASLARATLEGENVEPNYCSRQDLNSGTADRFQGIAISGGQVFIGIDENEFNFQNGRILGVDLTSCEKIADPQHSGVYTDGDIQGVAIEGTYIYWTIGHGETLGRVLLSDFAPGGCSSIPTCEPEYVKVEGSLTGLATHDGRLYWASNAEAPSNAGNDLYRYDAATGKLADLTPDANAGDPNGAEVRGILGNSDDGAYLYFAANGVLASGASPGSCSINTRPTDSCNLYLYHQGQISFIARLQDGDNWRGLARSSRGLGDEPKISRVSADGRTLLFTSAQKLTEYENAGKPELYRYRVGNPNPIVCVSCNPTGLLPSGAPGLISIRTEGITSIDPTPVLTRNLSADGNRVFFETREALVASDTNGSRDVYEWEAKGTGSCDSEAVNGGCLYLISSGTSPDPSFLVDASANGNDVFFLTRSRLAGQDEDEFLDVYDARVGGGLASQSEPPPAPVCEGEACKGGTTPPPGGSSPSTPLFSGPGNPKPQHKKSKPRKHKHKSHKHRRHAKQNGRAHR
jgi:hypothetical protein